jgi:hypothetical protein
MDSELAQPFNANNSAQFPWDLDQMVDQVWHDLKEEVDPRTIRPTLIGILASYKDARIQTFVPILACREAETILKAGKRNDSIIGESYRRD